ncbi:MAG: hypothetical protein IJB50_00315, partial [Clostridia bacterium]|nr:hypothetical protein [Clostridia bacterium]
NFGRIHIAKGANTINLTGNIGYANQKYIYNVKLVKSADQTESVKVDDIVIAGDSFTSTGTVAGGSGGVSQSETAGAALYWGAGQQKVPVYADYTLNVDTEGYYNVSVTITNAYGSSVYPSVDSGLAAATTITIDGTEYHGRYPAFDATTEITRVYLTAGEHDLRVSEITGASYDLNNITFSYDDVQAPSETIFIEPYSGSTTLGRIYFWEFTPGAGSCSWATPSQAGFYAGSTTSNADLNMNFVSDESAYYDVYIAYAAMQDADMIFKIGEETLTGVLPGADTESPAYETNFGRIHIAKGANTINLTGNIGPAYNEFIYNVKLVKSADQTEPPPQTSFVMDAQYFTTLTSGVVFDATGSTNNTAWAGTSGKRIYENRWGGVSNTIKISVSGYYDVALAYGTKLEGAQFVIYADNQVEVLQTDKLSAVGAGTITESALGRIYLTEGRHTINVYGSSPNDPDVDDSCPTVFYGLKLQYSDDEYQVDPTEYIISAEFPTSYSVGSNSEQKLLGYYITDNKCGWATHGATKIASSADWYEYELTVATAGYYNMAVAAGTTNESCRMTIDVNGVRYADGSYLVKSNEGEDVSVVDDTDFGKVYLKAGKNTIKVQGAENSGAYYFYNIKLTSTSSPAENEIRILDGYNAETATFNAGIDAYAEVHTSSDVKVFIVNYEDLGDGLMKMTGYSEGETVFTGDGFKIVRTTAPLSTSAGIVKAFLWADGTFAPIDLATATVNPAPEAE